MTSLGMDSHIDTLNLMAAEFFHESVRELNDSITSKQTSENFGMAAENSISSI